MNSYKPIEHYDRAELEKLNIEQLKEICEKTDTFFFWKAYKSIIKKYPKLAELEQS